MAASAIKWSESDTLKFIKLYKDCECLWNYKLKDYKNKDIRNKAYEYMKTEMEMNDLSIEQVKRKIKSIRDTFSVEKNKVKKSMKSGTSPEEVYKPRLIWFNDVDTFLDNRDGRNTFTNLELTETTSTLESKGECSTDEVGNTSAEVKKVGIIRNPQERNKSKKIKKSNSNQTAMPQHIISAIQKLDELKINAAQSDQFYYFGMHAAQQLRELPLERALKLQSKIQQLIMDERLEYEKDKQYNILYNSCSQSNSSWGVPSPLSPIILPPDRNEAVEYISDEISHSSTPLPTIAWDIHSANYCILNDEAGTVIEGEESRERSASQNRERVVSSEEKNTDILSLAMATILTGNN